MRGPAAIARCGLVAGAPLLVLLATKGFAADATTAPTVRLSWVRAQGAEGCIDRDTLARDVSARLGRDAFAGAPQRSIEGIVAREGKRWVARLYVRDPAGVLVGDREIASDAADYSALGGAVTLAVALVIDPEAALAPPPSTSGSTSTSVTASANAPPSASIAVAPPASASIVAPPVASVVVAPRPILVEARFAITTGLVP
ncbi:MAG: hypothetical protein ABI175_15430, partial [Polyangiales bacterium]